MVDTRPRAPYKCAVGKAINRFVRLECGGRWAGGWISLFAVRSCWERGRRSRLLLLVHAAGASFIETKLGDFIATQEFSYAGLSMRQARWIVGSSEREEMRIEESLCAREETVGASNGAVRELCSWY